jgi:hypothetical protein
MLVSHLMNNKTAIKVDSQTEKMRILIMLINSPLEGYKINGKFTDFTNYYIIVESKSKYNGQYSDIFGMPSDDGFNFIHSSDLYADRTTEGN